MVRVMLTAFKLTGAEKERRIKIGIALDAAPLTKKLSVFTVYIITSDPDAIDPKTGKNISEFFNVQYDRFIDCCSFHASLVSIPIPEKIKSRNLVFPVFQIIGKETKHNLENIAKVFEFFLFSLA
jgi:hypothetical protein